MVRILCTSVFSPCLQLQKPTMPARPSNAADWCHLALISIVSPQDPWRCRALTVTSTQPSLQCSPCMWFWLCLFTWPGMKVRRKGRARTTKARLHQLVRPWEMDRHRCKPADLQPQAPMPNTPPCTKHTAGGSDFYLGFDLNRLSIPWCRGSEPVLFVFEWLLKVCVLIFVWMLREDGPEVC